MSAAACCVDERGVKTVEQSYLLSPCRKSRALRNGDVLLFVCLFFCLFVCRQCLLMAAGAYCIGHFGRTALFRLQ